MALTIPHAGLTRPLTEDEREGYDSGGAAILRGILSEEWLQTLRTAMERVMADADAPHARRAEPPFRVWVLDAALIGLTRQVLPGASCITVYFDQIVGRGPVSGALMPLNRDSPYIPVMGDQVLRLSVPLDVVTVGNGAVRYLLGSHRGPVVRPEWLVGECEPGDVILHHPRTVHGTVENVAREYSRVVASTYCARGLRAVPEPGLELDLAEQAPGGD